MFCIESEFSSHITKSFSSNEKEIISQSKFYISGGTGFSGRWIVSIVRELFDIGDLPSIVIISRSPEKAEALFTGYPNLKVLSWSDLNKDARHCLEKERSVGFHASVPAASGGQISLGEVRRYGDDTNTFARWLGKKPIQPIFVNLSSGAVYQRPTTGSIPEVGAVFKPLAMSNYDLVKIADEEIVINLTRQGIVSGINPRLFSFTGPGVDTPGNFALGSFMYDALKGQAVRVSGSGNSTRSYMSPIDMGIWLLKASIRPATNTLHIGSPHGFKMSEIASIISRTFGNGEVEIASEQSLIPESYVPETAITEKFLEISETVELVQSLTFWRSQLD